jgi:alkanesulfonate monooxygenase SsuD/methylene tetrahydromethanopterin reductase-like flavin-dependent oxidoreductase (luciferase family)
MTPVTFGLFDWIDRGETPLQRLYEERLQLLEAADTDDEALAAARTAHGHWYRSITKLWHDHDDHTPDGLFAWEPAMQGETILCGSSRRVREQLARLLEVSGCNYVIGAFAWGTLPHAQTMRSLRLFVEEVMPAFTGRTAPVA